MNTDDALRQVALVKPKKNRVIFFGRDTFSDNTKYLYLHCISHPVKFEVVWCTKNRALSDLLKNHGLPVFDMSEMGRAKTLSFLIEARVAVFCTNLLESLGSFEYLTALSGAHKLQLWHGVSIKKLDLMLTNYCDLSDGQFLSQLLGVTAIDSIVSPSKREDDFWKEAFGVEKFIRAGLPRNEVLIRPPTQFELINSSDPAVFFGSKPSPRVLFAPTFSRNDRPLWENQAVIAEILRFTIERGGHLLIKPHPFEAKHVPDGGLYDEMFSLLPGEFDIYPLLSCVDIVITDYSSLFIDFMLTGKPAIILRLPLDEKNEHLLHDPERYRNAVPMVQLDELYQTLIQVIDEDVGRDLRKRAADTAFPDGADGACQEIALALSTIGI